MFPQYKKLTGKDIRTILATGKRATHEGITFVYKNTKNGTSRRTVVISSKTDKRAAKRNRAKRCVREAARKQLQGSPLSLDGVFIINKLQDKTTTSTYVLLLSALFKKISENQQTKP